MTGCHRHHPTLAHICHKEQGHTGDHECCAYRCGLTWPRKSKLVKKK